MWLVVVSLLKPLILFVFELEMCSSNFFPQFSGELSVGEIVSPTKKTRLQDPSQVR